MSELDQLIEVAKNKVSAIISKPKMSEKLLAKPPFRFLHDTISAIISTTGFAEGLYTTEEQDSGNINERDAKINYLQKMINCVGICIGSQLEVRAAKIVAGQEPELTCKFLINLCDCAINTNIDVQSSVNRTLNNEEPGTNPIPLKSTNSGSKSSSSNESKDSKEIKNKNLDSEPKNNNNIISDSKNINNNNNDSKNEPIIPERGMSRSGNRSGKQIISTAESAGLTNTSLNTVNTRNLDAEIDKCDGTEAVTQTLLGNLITKPKLTEKLLSKPPFRFLHDIIMEVMKQTGFGTNLYAPEEMDSAKVTEKEQKITFLDKIILLVGIQLQTNLTDIKSVKIIQGLEPNATNRFLQCLAVAAKNVPDSTNSVRVVLDQLGGTNTLSNVPVNNNTNVNNNNNNNNIQETVAPPKKNLQPPNIAEEKDPVVTKLSSKDVEPINNTHMDDTNNMNNNMNNNNINNNNQDNNNNNEEEGLRSMRPTTARRRPPKLKDEAKEVAAKDIAPSANNKKAEGILVDGVNDDDDILEIDDNIRLADELKVYQDTKNTEQIGGQSKLVQDIQNRRIEQEALARGSTTNVTNDNNDITTIPNTNNIADDKSNKGIRIGQSKKTGQDKKNSSGISSNSVTSGTDIEKLRTCIQLLVKCTGPLGSCMDFIQEDIGLMTNELKKWEEECRKYEIQLEIERSKSADELKALQYELNELDAQIKDSTLKITSTKANIARNENSVQQMLKTIVMA